MNEASDNSNQLALVNPSTSTQTIEEQEKDLVVKSLIRQIRPVSFKYKSSSDSKFSRFGFIAQELEAILPNVIHNDEGTGMKYVRYQDMIAVIALGIQSVDQRLIKMDQKVSSVQKKVDVNFLNLSDRLKTIEFLIKKVLINDKS